MSDSNNTIKRKENQYHHLKENNFISVKKRASLLSYKYICYEIFHSQK